MKRHIVLTGAVALIALVLGTFAQSNTPALADPSTVQWDVKFCAPNSSVVGNADACAAVDVVAGAAPGSSYDYVSYLELDPAAGPGGTPDEPFFDLATTNFNADATTVAEGGPATGLDVISGAATGAITGEIDFHLESNAPGTVNPLTGGISPCGSTPAGVGGNGSIYTAVRTPTALPNMADPAQFGASGNYVQSFDDDDGDLLEFVFGDDPDGDPGSTGSLNETPETQEDGIDLNDDGDFTDAGEEAPNGILDGAERMPDFLPRLYSAAGIGPVVAGGDAGRGYAVADVLAGVSTVDVGFIFLDLRLIGVPGVVSITTIGIVDPTSVYNPATAAQTLLTCPPFQSATTTFGITRDNPDTGANEGGFATRAVTGDFNYAITVSSTEDQDGDGIAAVVDRCNQSDTGGLDEADGDMVSGSTAVLDSDGKPGCDNRTGSADNCEPGGAAPACPVNIPFAGAISEGDVDRCNDGDDDDIDGLINDGCPAVGPAEAGAACANNIDNDGDTFPNDGCPASGASEVAILCTSLTEAVGAEGGSYSSGFPWDLDQDVDCDGAANFADNCPVTYNPSQRDQDSDTVGNACDDPDENGCSGDFSDPGAAKYDPCFIRSQGHDHDQSCNDPVDADPGAAEADDGGTATTCTVSQDSSDDGVLDLAAAAVFPGAPGGHEDINSDSDFDGCPDKDEVDGDAVCGMAGDPDDGDGVPNVYDPDSDNDSILDGNEDRNGGGVADWRDSVVDEPQTASNVFNNEGSPDSDGDGCSNRREAQIDANGNTGGNRNALNPYDFLDVPTPANGGTGADGKATLSAGSSRNRAVALTDVGVILAYVGRTSSNNGAAYYNGDLNNDGRADGRQMDRTAGAGLAENAGNLAIALTDVGIALDHVGDSCTGTP